VCGAWGGEKRQQQQRRRRKRRGERAEKRREGGGRKGGARVEKLQVHPSHHAEPPHPPDQRRPGPRATGPQSAAGVGLVLREQLLPTQSNLMEATLRPGTSASASEVSSVRRCLRPTAAMVVRCGSLLPHRVRIVLNDRVRATRGLRCSLSSRADQNSRIRVKASASRGNSKTTRGTRRGRRALNVTRRQQATPRAGNT